METSLTSLVSIMDKKVMGLILVHIEKELMLQVLERNLFGCLRDPPPSQLTLVDLRKFGY